MFPWESSSKTSNNRCCAFLGGQCKFFPGSSVLHANMPAYENANSTDNDTRIQNGTCDALWPSTCCGPDTSLNCDEFAPPLTISAPNFIGFGMEVVCEDHLCEVSLVHKEGLADQLDVRAGFIITHQNGDPINQLNEFDEYVTGSMSLSFVPANTLSHLALWFAGSFLAPFHSRNCSTEGPPKLPALARLNCELELARWMCLHSSNNPSLKNHLRTSSVTTLCKGQIVVQFSCAETTDGAAQATACTHCNLTQKHGAICHGSATGEWGSCVGLRVASCPGSPRVRGRKLQVIDLSQVTIMTGADGTAGADDDQGNTGCYDDDVAIQGRYGASQTCWKRRGFCSSKDHRDSEAEMYMHTFCPNTCYRCNCDRTNWYDYVDVSNKEECYFYKDYYCIAEPRRCMSTCCVDLQYRLGSPRCVDLGGGWTVVDTEVECADARGRIPHSPKLFETAVKNHAWSLHRDLYQCTNE